MAWPPELLEHVRPSADVSFPEHLRALARSGDFPHAPWPLLVLPEERGLEAWVGWSALHGRRAFVAVAAAVARFAYPIVIERAGEEAMKNGLHVDAPTADGASEGEKLRRVAAWLADPSPSTLAAVKAGIDGTRQLEVWDEDLTPPDDEMWWWFMAVGELAAEAVVRKEEGVVTKEYDSEAWPAAVCAARSAVCALRSIRRPDGDLEADLTAMGRAVAETFGVK